MRSSSTQLGWHGPRKGQGPVLHCPRGLRPSPRERKPCKTTDTDEIYYFNFQTGRAWDHPCDEFYRNLYEKEKKAKQQREKVSAGVSIIFPPTSNEASPFLSFLAAVQVGHEEEAGQEGRRRDARQGGEEEKKRDRKKASPRLATSGRSSLRAGIEPLLSASPSGAREPVQSRL